MATEYLKAVLAVVLFVCFPFLVIAAAAGVLVVMDRVGQHRPHLR